ncbi:MAG: glycoside hydrolase family 5 protein [Rhodopirellula sp.]|nr:glycoside hydrolase family 5 protein [Rhodopirellula sp.]
MPAVSLIVDAKLQERFIPLWLEFERRYHDRPDVAFELLNEVRDIDPKLWNDLAQRTVEGIRAKNPTRKIILGGTRWNSAAAERERNSVLRLELSQHAERRQPVQSRR